MERMMDGGSGYGSEPMSSGSDMGMAGGESPAPKAATRKKAGGSKRKKASKPRGRAKGKARGKARGRSRARATKKKGARKARRR